MQQAHNILADAEYWLDTFRAPREVANKYRIAYMSTDRSAVAEGGLVSMSANFPVLYEQAATYVDRILKGASPAILPVEQPSKFQVTVNNKTAQALGLSIPPAVRRQHGRLQRVRSKKGSPEVPMQFLSSLLCEGTEIRQVRFGSLDIYRCGSHVRSTRESGHSGSANIMSAKCQKRT
ncbi:MAG: ABC transporter substrate binding protein [Pseudolabrys sp.]